MVSSYEDIMGTPMDVEDHSAYNKPDASQHYAGDVLPIPGERSMGSGPTSQAAGYAVGKDKDPKVLSIGMPTLKSWHDRNK
jgi:hypothetical protein